MMMMKKKYTSMTVLGAIGWVLQVEANTNIPPPPLPILPSEIESNPSTAGSSSHSSTSSGSHDEVNTIEPLGAFRLLDAEGMVGWMKSLQDMYSDFVQVSTAQSEFGLPRAGTENDCPFDPKDDNGVGSFTNGEDGKVGCLNHFMTIQDFVAHPVGSKSSNELPELLWVGSLHGGSGEDNDQQLLGPTAVLETVILMLEAASCESKPNMDSENQWYQEVLNARACRDVLKLKGVDDTHRQWLARLLSTRRIVVVPNANALGYYRNEKTEDGIDPVLDFPYNHNSDSDPEKGPQNCMRTITARTLNELFRSHMFQAVVMFEHDSSSQHIEYSWKSQPHLPPDAVSMFKLGQAMSGVSGGISQYPWGMKYNHTAEQNYRFQDWAYAASWENIRIQPACEPETYGGYDLKKTKEYPRSTNRATAFTISTFLDPTVKGDLRHKLGTPMDIFHGEDDTEGLIVAKNIRQILVMTDLVSPYVSIFGINALAISDDVVPSYETSQDLCDASRAVAVSSTSGTVSVEWTVGGSLNINQTELWVARVSDFKDKSACDLSFDSVDDVDAIFKMVPSWDAGPSFGTGFFSADGPHPYPWTSFSRPWNFMNSEPGTTPSFEINSMGSLKVQPDTTGQDSKIPPSTANILGPVFRANFDLSDYQAGERLVVVATAKVDSDWAEPPSGYYQPSGVQPQGHLVNSRTNPDYEFEISDKTMKGRSHWVSTPVTIYLQNLDNTKPTLELYKRLDSEAQYTKPPPRPYSIFEDNESSSSSSSSNSDLSMVYIIIASIAVPLIVGIFVFLLYRRSIKNNRTKVVKMSSPTKDGIMAMKQTYETYQDRPLPSPPSPDVFNQHHQFQTTTAPTLVSSPAIMVEEEDFTGELEDINMDTVDFQNEAAIV